ncbi:RHS repeat-associated core domain-containing protein [Promicromonospora aerolata]|uniref:RHS repeat-associated core domain-containing protein n=1 Tax=Promicromonospora aerolata TaxID=195749 RepID=A0ABW4V8I1_9MICO
MTSLISDVQNTAVFQISNVANVVTRRYLDPFGADRSSAAGVAPDDAGGSGWVGDHGFLDKPTDATGLTAVGARMYDAVSGRFISVDPIMDLTDPQQWNAYSYGNNNPVTWSDPTGLEPRPWHEEGKSFDDFDQETIDAYSSSDGWRIGWGNLWQTKTVVPVTQGNGLGNDTLDWGALAQRTGPSRNSVRVTRLAPNKNAN